MSANSQWTAHCLYVESMSTDQCVLELFFILFSENTLLGALCQNLQGRFVDVLCEIHPPQQCLAFSISV